MMKKIKPHILLVLTCSLLISGPAHSKRVQDLSKYQALFITKFIDFIHWTNKPDEIVIGIVGNSRVLIELQKTLKSRGKNDRVKKISGMSDIAGCDMVFIPSNQNKLFTNIKSATEGKPVLIMTETESLANKGSVITFYTEENKLRLIIDKKAADSRGITISTKLLGMGRVL